MSNTEFETAWRVWRCRSSFTLREASALLSGILPSELNGYSDREFHTGYEAFLGLLLSAVEEGVLHVIVKKHSCDPIQTPKLAPNTFDHVEPEFATEDHIESSLIHYWLPCPCKTEAKVTAKKLKAFLESQGISSPFFGVTSDVEAGKPQYLDPNHDCYAPKLAAAVCAWKEVSVAFDSGAGKSPKAALFQWIKSNTKTLGINPADLTCKEIAKVANWKLKGGANKTPTKRSAR